MALKNPIRFAIVAGEDSGDLLGASLIQSLRARFPEAIFEGVGGERMLAQGLKGLFPLSRLAVMGLIEPLKHLPDLLYIRQSLKRYFLKKKPTVFIGIDAPDFNLSLEATLKKQQIKTVHLVSPSIWAWREKRIDKIKKAVDLMLVLFPFEAALYQQHAIRVHYIGHPLADTSLPLDKVTARKQLQLPLDQKVVALLPGSRAQELRHMAKTFVDTAHWLRAHYPFIHFVTAFANAKRAKQFSTYCQLPVQAASCAQQAMIAADAVLVASGTAALEAMLVKRPTVVAYKTSPLTYAIAKKMVKVPYIALPNLLADQEIMPEYIQSQAKPALMGKALLDYLSCPQKIAPTLDLFDKITQSLKCNAAQKASLAIADLTKDISCPV